MKREQPYNRQTEGLKKYAEVRRKEAEEKADRVIDEMSRHGEKINFSAVAERAHISRTTLYGNIRLRERISSLSGSGGSGKGKENPDSGEAEKVLKGLRLRIRQLEMEKGKLVEQLVDYHEIKRENERLKEQLMRKDRRETK